MTLRRFMVDALVTAEMLRGADHTKVDIWALNYPFDAKVGTVQIDKLLIPTDPSEHRNTDLDREIITVRIFGRAERIECADREAL